MNNKEFKSIDKRIDYNVLKQIQEHSKKYNETNDKKEFLKNVSAYEQKIILLNSDNPYEVLSYLDELDLKSSRIVLNELNYDEIMKIIELFSSEDKKKFYLNFSDLSLVNQFLIFDKGSKDYIEELPLERKVDLIESTKEETKAASLKVYESMTFNERTEVLDDIKSTEASTAIASSSEYKEDVKTNEAIESNQVENIDKNEITDNILKQIKEKTEEEQKEEKTEEEQKEEKTEEEQKEEKTEEEQKEEKTEEEQNIEYYEKYSIIGNGSSEASLVSNPKLGEIFSQAKQVCEQEEITKIVNQTKENIESQSKLL